MLVLLHGDDIDSSRRELQRVRDHAKGKDIRHLDGRTMTASDLTQALESSSLFGKDTVVVIEHLFTKISKREKAVAQLVTLLAQSAESSNIILWEEKEVGKTAIAMLGNKMNIQLYKMPKVIFQLLDALAPGNGRTLLLLLRQSLKNQPAEVIYTMVVRRLRQLLMVASGVQPDGIQPWQAQRLTRQSRLFTMEKLKAMYHKLFQIEYSLKTGSSPFDLAANVEQFLISI